MNSSNNSLLITASENIFVLDAFDLSDPQSRTLFNIAMYSQGNQDLRNCDALVCVCIFWILTFIVKGHQVCFVSSYP